MDGIMIPDDVFNFIANNVTENVRDLEGDSRLFNG